MDTGESERMVISANNLGNENIIGVINTGHVNYNYTGNKNWERNYNFKFGDKLQVRISSNDFRRGSITITGYVYGGNTWRFV